MDPRHMDRWEVNDECRLLRAERDTALAAKEAAERTLESERIRFGEVVLAKRAECAALLARAEAADDLLRVANEAIRELRARADARIEEQRARAEAAERERDESDTECGLAMRALDQCMTERDQANAELSRLRLAPEHLRVIRGWYQAACMGVSNDPDDMAALAALDAAYGGDGER